MHSLDHWILWCRQHNTLRELLFRQYESIIWRFTCGLTLMTDFSRSILASCLCLVTHTVIVQIQLVAAVSARIDTKRDGIHLAVTIQLTNVLLNLTLGYNGAFSDVNGTVISGRVVPKGVEIELHPTIDRILQWILVICKTVPLTPSGEVDSTARLTFWYNKLRTAFPLSGVQLLCTKMRCLKKVLGGYS